MYVDLTTLRVNRGFELVAANGLPCFSCSSEVVIIISSVLRNKQAVCCQFKC